MTRSVPESSEANFVRALGAQWVGIPRARAEKERSAIAPAATTSAREPTSAAAAVAVARPWDWSAARGPCAGTGASRCPDAPAPSWLDMTSLGARCGPVMPGMSGLQARRELCSQQSSMCGQMHTYNPQETAGAGDEIPVLLGSSGPGGLGEGKKDELGFDSLYQDVGAAWAGTSAAPEADSWAQFRAPGETARLEAELQELKRRLQQEQAKAADAAAEAKRLQAALKETAKFVDIQPDRLRAAVQHVMEIGWSNITWRRQYTALHLAAECGNADVMPLLVRLGADPSARDSKGRTAADVAAAKSHATCAEALARLAEVEEGTVFTL